MSTLTLRRALISVAILSAGSGFLSAAGQGPAGPVPSHGSTFRALLDRYCVTCHNEKARTAGMVLSTPDLDKVGNAPEI